MRFFKLMTPVAAATAVALCMGMSGTSAQAGTCGVVTDLTGGSGQPAGTTTNDCTNLITIQKNGQISISNPAGKQNYDGSDDAYVGVLNLSNILVSSIHLQGIGNQGIFAFDGDGICEARFSFPGNGGCPVTAAPNNYAGPNSSFANIAAFGGLGANQGDVIFTSALGTGQVGIFSLENPAAAVCASINGGNVVCSSVPEPATLATFGFALAGLGLMRRRKSA